ncbi:complex I NDUFA9 subunit family protein [Burkholderia sp. L27(2015)]|uniref:complex I NDUFA9 subunit family protein n=1 Tax=Burkholderia sp. L27(2015) TaxID=1641858 RepID=UPI00131AEB14|nr:complex I NDUFA9 subunit family protein [Burkholderia sp. L27(2015)]
MRHQTIAVIGGSGFIGSELINRLVADGRNVRVATRRRESAKRLTIYPVDVLEVNLFDPAQLDVFLRGADAVINLVGILHSRRGEPYGTDFARMHVELPKKIASACAAENIRRVIHISALGADPQGSSMYLRSKGDGERALQAARGLDTTIFRPSVVFGPGDAFLNTFASLQRAFPVIPLACAKARFQPVYVGDVVQAIVNALDNAETYGKTYALAGPRVYTLSELVRFAGQAVGRDRRIYALPGFVGRLQARLFEMLPGPPMLTRDNLDSMKTDNVMSGPIAPELGITPTSLEAVAPEYLSGLTLRERMNIYRSNAHR